MDGLPDDFRDVVADIVLVLCMYVAFYCCFRFLFLCTPGVRLTTVNSNEKAL